jgi:sodium-dependent dicarboxylate transporter 2/3/5
MAEASEARGPSLVRKLGLVAGPLVCALVMLAPSPLQHLEGLGHRPAFAAGVSLLMAIWWFTEALPIHWTSLVPLLAWPVLDVFGAGVAGSASKTAQEFVNAYIFLFAGGMAIGAAMEHSNLHRRVALHLMLRIGASPGRLLLGMLVSTAAISLWISNTATAVMMMPIGLAVVSQLEARTGRRLGRYASALMLAVAYASNVGGIGTKIGSATNSIFVGFLSAKARHDMSFFEYVAVALPFVALFLPLIWLVLWKLGAHDAPHDATGKDVLRAELDAQGPMTRREKQVAQAFLFAAMLWILGDPLRALVKPLLPFPFEARHFEAAVALLGAAVLLVRGALPIAAVKRIPLSALLLLGGSFAMAAGIEGSGLSKWLGLQLDSVRALPMLAQLAVSVAATVALSAVASNTATVNLMLALLPLNLPLLSAVSMAASCDFALPAGTPPNAIVFGSGRVHLPTMMRVGALLDLAAVLVLTLYGATWLPLVLG